MLLLCTSIACLPAACRSRSQFSSCLHCSRVFMMVILRSQRKDRPREMASRSSFERSERQVDAQTVLNGLSTLSGALTAALPSSGLKHTRIYGCAL